MKNITVSELKDNVEKKRNTDYWTEVPCTRWKRPPYKELNICIVGDPDQRSIKATFALKPSLKSIEKHKGLYAAFKAIIQALERIEEPVGIIQEGHEDEEPWIRSRDF